MRLVDADALKEKLNSFLIVGGRGYGKTECQRYLNKILSEIIDDVPTADVELLMKHECWIHDGEDRPTVETEPDKGWISVKDRLPGNDYLYIVCKTIRGHRISFEARWKGNKWLSVVKNNQLDYVTHWMPLPEPPKGE